MTDDRPAWGPPQVVPPETLAAARRLYETTSMPVAEIARRAGIDRGVVRRRVRSGGWLRPQDAAKREALLNKVRLKLDAEVAATDRVFGAAAGVAGDEAGRAARNLSSLVKALRELAQYDREQGRGPAREDADDACPDIDQFRRDLAERLAKLQSRDA